MTGHSTGGGKLAKERPYSSRILCDFWMNRGVGSFQIRIRIQGRASVSGAGNIEDAGLLFADQAIEMHIDEAEARRSSPVPEQARLDVFLEKRLAEQRILLKVDLPDRKEIRRLPVAMHFVE